MRFPIPAGHTFVVALGLLLGPCWACLGEDCNHNGRPDDQDLAPAHIAFGALEEFEVVESGDTVWSSAVGDFDNDGSMDVVVVSLAGIVNLILNKGPGTFDEPVLIANASFPSNADALDFDQDGATDIVHLENADVVILRNLGAGFADPQKHMIPSQFPIEHLVAADLDGDAVPEFLATGGFSEGKLFILQSDVGGALAATEYLIAGFPWRPLVGDMDGDGKADIFVFSDEERSCQFLQSQGNATFATARLLALEPFGAFPYLLADFDGDKDLDLSDGRFIYHNDGQANFGAGELIDVPLSTGDPRVEDVDGDQDPDLFDSVRGGIGLSVSLNSGNGRFLPSLQYARSGPYSPRAFADFNRDGFLDFLGIDSSCGKGAVLFRLPGLFPQSQDVDGNGIPDECQPDINRNGLPDSYEIATGQSPDCNRNGVPDAWEVQKGFDFREGWKTTDLPEFYRSGLIHLQASIRTIQARRSL